jgi:hypothetical protein
MKQTAVEYVIQEIEKLAGVKIARDEDIIIKAKEMEKQLIIDARQDGYECTYAEYGETPKCYLDGSNEQYYNETFKQQ